MEATHVTDITSFEAFRIDLARERLLSELKGFAIASLDKAFRWAKAKIDGDSVLVWNETMPNPAFVRCAWANNPECTLYNAAGLPAVPFRTDD